LGERELCKLEVVGSIPIGSTTFAARQLWLAGQRSLIIAVKFAVTTEIMISKTVIATDRRFRNVL
jgi:hypothetical protein